MPRPPYGVSTGRDPAGIEEKTMFIAALGLLSVELWLTYLATVLLALRLQRGLQFSDRLVAALAKPRPQYRRSDSLR
jgi:hypothetical protein